MSDKTKQGEVRTMSDGSGIKVGDTYWHEHLGPFDVRALEHGWVTLRGGDADEVWTWRGRISELADAGFMSDAEVRERGIDPYEGHLRVVPQDSWEGLLCKARTAARDAAGLAVGTVKTPDEATRGTACICALASAVRDIIRAIERKEGVET